MGLGGRALHNPPSGVTRDGPPKAGQSSQAVKAVRSESRLRNKTRYENTKYRYDAAWPLPGDHSHQVESASCDHQRKVSMSSGGFCVNLDRMSARKACPQLTGSLPTAALRPPAFRANKRLPHCKKEVGERPCSARGQCARRKTLRLLDCDAPGPDSRGHRVETIASMPRRYYHVSRGVSCLYRSKGESR
jgi:hypothetical protein